MANWVFGRLRVSLSRFFLSSCLSCRFFGGWVTAGGASGMNSPWQGSLRGGSAGHHGQTLIVRGARSLGLCTGQLKGDGARDVRVLVYVYMEAGKPGPVYN